MPPARRAAAALGIDYRPETEADQSFMLALYVSTRAFEFSDLGWPEETLAALLQQQYLAQHRHFRAIYPDGEWLVVEQSGQGIGRLYLNAAEDHVRLIDIILRPQSRGRGIGTAIIADIIDLAHGGDKSVRLSVEKTNPDATRLYRRLGFEEFEDHGLHQAMICRSLAGGRIQS